MMKTMSIRMNPEGLDEFSKVLRENRSEVVRELVEEGRKRKAVNLFKEDKVSLGFGAKLAGVTITEFLDLLEEHDVKLNLDERDAEEALENVREKW